jgi:hypothetical protein
MRGDIIVRREDMNELIRATDKVIGLPNDVDKALNKIWANMRLKKR